MTSPSRRIIVQIALLAGLLALAGWGLEESIGSEELSEHPLTSNILGGILTVPASALAAFLLIERNLRMQEDKKRAASVRVHASAALPGLRWTGHLADTNGQRYEDALTKVEQFIEEDWLLPRLQWEWERLVVALSVSVDALLRLAERVPDDAAFEAAFAQVAQSLSDLQIEHRPLTQNASDFLLGGTARHRAESVMRLQEGLALLRPQVEMLALAQRRERPVWRKSWRGWLVKSPQRTS